MKEKRRYAPLTQRHGFRVIGFLLVLVIALWAASAFIQHEYPKMAAFLWREGWFFIALAFLYRICLGVEEKKIIQKRYGRNDNDDEVSKDQSA